MNIGENKHFCNSIFFADFWKLAKMFVTIFYARKNLARMKHIVRNKHREEIFEKNKLLWLLAKVNRRSKLRSPFHCALREINYCINLLISRIVLIYVNYDNFFPRKFLSTCYIPCVKAVSIRSSVPVVSIATREEK